MALKSISFEADLNRLKRAERIVRGRLWGSGNWTPRGDEMGYSILTAMSAIYGGMRFKRFIVPKRIVEKVIGSGRYSRLGNESLHHSQLKAVAKALLVEWGHKDAVTELSWFGGRVDVASRKGRVFVECGDTDPRRIISLAFEENATSILVPYSRQNEFACFAPFDDMHFYSFAMTDAAERACEHMKQLEAEEFRKRMEARRKWTSRQTAG